MDARPYQEAARLATYAHFNSGSPLGAMVCLPTGTGKTFTAMLQVVDAMRRGHRVLWIAHTRELVTQPVQTLRVMVGPKAIPKVGVVMANQNEADRQVVFASVQTLRSEARLAEYLRHGAPRFVVCDEAHHTASDEYQTVLAGLGKGGSEAPLFLGLTATPERLDGKALSKDWTIVSSKSTQWAIESGFLVPFSSHVERLPGLTLPESTREDYDDKELAAALLEAHVVEHTVQAVLGHAKGRTGVVFTASIQQAQETAAAMQEAGLKARWVSGAMPRADRDGVLAALRDGTIQWVCNAQVLTEGWDNPRVDACVVARPTRSKALYLQMVGRSLRANWPGKEDAVIIDIAGAADEFGDLIIAPVLIDIVKDEEASRCPNHADGKHVYMSVTPYTRACECGKEITASGEDVKSILDGLLKKRKRVKATWVQLPRVDRKCYVCDVGKHGLVFVTRDLHDPTLYWSHHLAKRARTVAPLADIPVDIGLAYGLGDDVVRRARGLVKPDAKWRRDPATPKQRAHANSLGLNLKPHATKGEAADAITRAQARKRAIKVGLVRSAQLMERTG